VDAFSRPIIVLGNWYKPINRAVAWFNCRTAGQNYGPYFAQAASTAALLLNTNLTNQQKELLAIRLIQAGLDTYGALLAGGSFPGEGGQNIGHKLPVLLAGVLLEDAAIVSAAHGSLLKFSEDIQHFYVTQQDIDTPRGTVEGQTIDPYPQEALGLPEWGGEGGYPNTKSGYNWGRVYRTLVGQPLTGHVAAVKIMGLDSVWGDDAFLEYQIDRYVPTETQGGQNLDPWSVSMLDLALTP
jgi:hypothetical protein